MKPTLTKIVKAQFLLVFYVGTLVFYNFFNVGHHILHLIPNPWHSHEAIHHHAHSHHHILPSGLRGLHNLQDHLAHATQSMPEEAQKSKNNLKIFYCFEGVASAAVFSEELLFTPVLPFSFFDGINLPLTSLSPQYLPPDVPLT